MTQYATLRIIVSIFGFILVSTDNVHEIRISSILRLINQKNFVCITNSVILY
jgi:hypothetical protein